MWDWKRKSWTFDDRIEIAGLLHVFLRSRSWPFSWNIHLFALMPILLFIFFLPFAPPFHLCPSLFSPHLHLHSFLSTIPSYTLCPLTLNHRWTKQWAVSHSIKTNNPVTGRVVVPSRSCGNQALRSLGPSSHKSQKAMIQFTDGHIKQLIHTHTVTQKWEHQEAALSESISCLSFHTFTSSISRRYGIDRRYWLPIPLANHR